MCLQLTVCVRSYFTLVPMLVNSELPSTYRSALADLLSALYVDREPRYKIDELKMVCLSDDSTRDQQTSKPERMWTQVSAADTPSLQAECECQEDPFHEFPQLRPEEEQIDNLQEKLLAYLSPYIKRETVVEWQHTNKMLELLLLLLQLGYYHDSKDHAPQMLPLAKILDAVS